MFSRRSFLSIAGAAVVLALGAAVLSSTLLAPPRPAEAADEPFDEPVREAA